MHFVLQQKRTNNLTYECAYSIYRHNCQTRYNNSPQTIAVGWQSILQIIQLLVFSLRVRQLFIPTNANVIRAVWTRRGWGEMSAMPLSCSNPLSSKASHTLLSLLAAWFRDKNRLHIVYTTNWRRFWLHHTIFKNAIGMAADSTEHSKYWHYLL